jgi:dGTPase
MYRDDGGMRLALGSLGTFTKYPVSASARRHVGAEGVCNGTEYIGLKKYGLFEKTSPSSTQSPQSWEFRRSQRRLLMAQ